MDDVEPTTVPGEGSAPAVERGRRSDQRWSSRRRRRRREKAERRQQARVEAQARRDAERAERAERVDREPSVDPADVAEPVERVSSRHQRTARVRATRRRRALGSAGRGLMVVALLVAAAGAGVAARLAMRSTPEQLVDDAGQPMLPAGVDRQPALLLVTSDEATDPLPADSAIILAYDRLERTGTILLVPVSTVADIPGHGVLPLGRSLEFGGAALAQAATDNLLGVSLDGVAAMTYRSWATLFARAGELEIEVPERIVEATEDGGNQVQFLAGVQRLDGPRAAEYLGARNAGQPELSALPRIQALLVEWFTTLSEDPALAAAALEDGLPMIDTGLARTEVVDLFRELIAAVADERLDVRVLPVRPIGSGADEGYRPDPTRLDQLVADRLAGSVPDVDREGRSLQVLNGNGQPGIGQDVAARLLPAGFRVVLTGNADDFDHEVTRIVVYDDSPEQLAIAQEIRDLLGVGEIEISLTPQSVVDVTIVVGADFTAS